MKFKKLSTLIVEPKKTEKINRMWNMVYPILKTQYVLLNGISKVDLVTGKKYVGDLEGLFSNVLGVKPEYILPHILVNGYNSSQDYDGNQLEFLMIDENKLHQYLSAAIRTERLITSTVRL